MAYLVGEEASKTYVEENAFIPPNKEQIWIGDKTAQEVLTSIRPKVEDILKGSA